MARNKWTQEEIKFIKENYLILSDKQISEYFQTHTEKSVATKRKRMGLLNPNPYHRKYTFKDVLDEFAKTDYILLSSEDDYVNAATNSLRYLCPRHLDNGELTISLGHLQSGRGPWDHQRGQQKAAPQGASVHQAVSLLILR